MPTQRLDPNEALRLELRAWLQENLPAGWSEQEFVPHHPDIYQQARFELWWHNKLFEGGSAGQVAGSTVTAEPVPTKA